jgi:hypothetical protein
MCELAHISAARHPRSLNRLLIVSRADCDMEWAKVAFQYQDLLTLPLYLSSMARRGSRASKPSGKWLEMGQCSPPRDLLSELLPPDYCPQLLTSSDQYSLQDSARLRARKAQICRIRPAAMLVDEFKDIP